MGKFFTSDTHYYHNNIIRYCKRPYKNVGQMNEDLIDRWNRRVKPEDEIYHLGDVAMGSNADLVNNILSRLNGTKYLIRGNHDRKLVDRISKSFEWVKDYYELKVQDDDMDLKQFIVLFHYPMETWNHSHHGSWHLHGHCHGTLPSGDHQARLDVGVDVHDMAPISYEEVKTIMTRKVFKPVDHHGRKKEVRR